MNQKSAMRTSNIVRSVTRALSILECFLAVDEIKFSDIVKETKLSNGTVNRLLESLIDRDFLIKNKDGSYSLGNKIYILGLLKTKNLKFGNLVHPVLEEISSLSKESANASILFENWLICIDIVEGVHTLKSTVPIGEKEFLHSSASGKVILANLEDKELSEVLSNISLERRTENTITDKALLLKELNKIRDQGYAIDNEENEPGAKCVASCVFDQYGGVAGAISISGFSHRIDKDMDYFIDLVKKQSNKVSLKLGYYIRK